jgi:phosphate transport system substrate-binding protein
LRAFIEAFVSDAASGRGGYLQDRGLIPLPAAEREAQKQAVKALTAMNAPAS